MPSTATITTFYTFTANTKARATQVNNNFDIFRGHSVPINTDTATASNNSHDLGSTEHRWRTGYFGTGLDFTGSADIFLSGSTVGSFGSNGYKRSTIEPITSLATYTADFSAEGGGTTLTVFAGSTLSSSVNGKTTYMIGIFPYSLTGGAAYEIGFSEVNSTNGTAFIIRFYRNGTDISHMTWRYSHIPSGSANPRFSSGAPVFIFDTPGATSSCQYYLAGESGAAGQRVSITGRIGMIPV